MQQVYQFKGIALQIPPSVYAPSEDSLLLAESISVEKGCTAIDVGCGSGIQTLNMLSKGAEKVIALDTSEEALEATMKNCGAAGFGKKVDARKSDLFKNCREKSDLIVFNPPYIATADKKFSDLDGGKNGREVLDRFLAQMPAHLNEGGECYFLQTNLNGYAQTEQKLKKLGLSFNVAARKKLFFEELAVYRCWRHGVQSRE